jgi:hypothetical protein
MKAVTMSPTTRLQQLQQVPMITLQLLGLVAGQPVQAGHSGTPSRNLLR